MVLILGFGRTLTLARILQKQSRGGILQKLLQGSEVKHH